MRRAALIVLVFTISAFSKCSPSAPTSVAGTNTTITGTVLERLDGPPYSYLRVKTDKGEKTWVAVPMGSVASGAKVTIKHGAALKNFQPPRVGKRFDTVVFGSVE